MTHWPPNQCAAANPAAASRSQSLRPCAAGSLSLERYAETGRIHNWQIDHILLLESKRLIGAVPVLRPIRPR